MKCIHLSVATKDCYVMNIAVDSLRKRGYGFAYSGYNSVDLDDNEMNLRSFLDDIRDADIIFIRVHGDLSYFKKYGRVKELISELSIPVLLVCTDSEVTEANRDMFPGDDITYRRLVAYASLGSDENYASLLLWALKEYDGIDVTVPDPVVPPAQGIYYPGRGSVDFEDFIEGLDITRPSIGIFFHQKQWTTHNMGNVDSLIKAVEGTGCNAVPVFLCTYPNSVLGSVGVEGVLFKHLWKDGPVLDCIIETMSFSQTLSVSEQEYIQDTENNVFTRYGVPVVQSMILSEDREWWENDMTGMTPSEIAYYIAHPEFDGQIISVANATTEVEGNNRLYRSIEDRAERVADMAMRWARLRRKENRERRVAILFYMYPPKLSAAGGASGLDTFQSVVDILHRMKGDGYYVGEEIPDDAGTLSEMVTKGVSNDQTWMTDKDVREKAVDLVGLDRYLEWYSAVPDKARDRIEEDWGKPPGNHYTVKTDIIVPGVLFGNIFVGFQPDRGRDIQANYHDPDTVHPHQYLAYYSWLKNDFGADAVIHVGTHGTLEWLPGKSVALSGSCCPDYILNAVPDIYPYIIGNPGEGAQAKRRSAAVIVDHNIPAMTRSGGYDEIMEIEGVLQNYMNAERQSQPDKMSMILPVIRERMTEMNLFSDMGLSPDCDDSVLSEHIDGLYDYIGDLKQNLIKDGLHCLGRPPVNERLNESIYALTRLDNGDIPSLRSSIAKEKGYDIYDLLHDPSGFVGDQTKSQIIDFIEDCCDDIINRMAEYGFRKDVILANVMPSFPDDDGSLERTITFICEELYPNLMATTGEIDSVMNALRGEFIPPGPSGCPTRGRAQLLPTGKNFYSLDPESVPWQSSWKVGCRMADQMLERYVAEHGCHPRSIGMVIWATDTMKTGGDDLAYILWLMGIRPVWAGCAGGVIDLEVVPLEELGRPRIDVTVRISGLFRDTFPNLVNMIDRAVKMIEAQDESDEDNYLRANVRNDVIRSIAEGIPEDKARSDSIIRIFGDAPGTYGCGTNILIRTSDWNDIDDIASIYRSYGEYAYGIGRKGERAPEAFRRRLASMEVTIKNSTSREYDMLDNDDVYDVLGGLNAAVRSAKGEMPESFIGCSADTANTSLRTIDEEQRYIFRSKVMNPKWFEGLKQHGFRGAQELSNLTEYYFAWDATSQIGEDWLYQEIADRFLFNKENSDWLRDANPYAMYDMASRLLEAITRGMWSADEDTEKQLKELYLDLESRFEEGFDTHI